MAAGDAYGQAALGGDISDGGSFSISGGNALEGQGGNVAVTGGASSKGNFVTPEHAWKELIHRHKILTNPYYFS